MKVTEEGVKVATVGEIRNALSDFDENEPVFGRINMPEYSIGFINPVVMKISRAKGAVIDLSFDNQE